MTTLTGAATGHTLTTALTCAALTLRPCAATLTCTTLTCALLSPAPERPSLGTLARKLGSWEGMRTTKHNDVTLTAAEERELARIDADGDGII